MKIKRPSALRDRALVLVLLDTGIRASELTALKMRDYELKRELIVHRGKGGESGALTQLSRRPGGAELPGPSPATAMAVAEKFARLANGLIE